MLRHSVAVARGSLLRVSTSLSVRPLHSVNLFRPSIRALATSTKAQEHYSKAFKSINKPASSSPPTVNSYPTVPSEPAAATSTVAASPVAPPASPTPRLGTAVTYARRLSPATPSPFHAGPPDEPPNPFDDPNSLFGRLWLGFAYFFRTFLQGMLIFGWVLVATRIVLTFYPPEEWGKTATVTESTGAAANSSSVALTPAVAESSSQTSAQ